MVHKSLVTTHHLLDFRVDQPFVGALPSVEFQELVDLLVHVAAKSALDHKDVVPYKHLSVFSLSLHDLVLLWSWLRRLFMRFLNHSTQNSLVILHHFVEFLLILLSLDYLLEILFDVKLISSVSQIVSSSSSQLSIVMA